METDQTPCYAVSDLLLHYSPMYHVTTTWMDPERAQGVWTHPLKNHKNIGFLSNTGPDPLKNHKDIKPAFNVGPPSLFRWRADDAPLLVLLVSTILIAIQRSFQNWIPSGKTFCIRAWTK